MPAKENFKAVNAREEKKRGATLLVNLMLHGYTRVKVKLVDDSHLHIVVECVMCAFRYTVSRGPEKPKNKNSSVAKRAATTRKNAISRDKTGVYRDILQAFNSLFFSFFLFYVLTRFNFPIGADV